MIRKAVDYILTKSVGKSQPRVDPTKLASTPDKHEVNAISANELSNIGFGDFDTEAANNSNDFKSKQSKYRNWNANVARDGNWYDKKGRGGRGRGYNRRGGRGNRGRYGNGNSDRGVGRSSYNRGRGRGRSRGRPAWYFHSRNKNGVPIPMFKNVKCKKCGTEGHIDWQCDWIRKDYPYMIDAFEKMAQNTTNNKNIKSNSNSNDNNNNNKNKDNTNDNNQINTILNSTDKFYFH